MTALRVAIVSRIFAPEPSAATFRLTALAEELSEAGHHVLVRTVTAPRAKDLSGTSYAVRRFPVLRDAAGYVRGYLPYLSFDLPLLFRVLFGKRSDVIVVEPPPTTGAVVRVASWLRRTPYVYYAADIWSDAAQQTGAPRLISRVVRAVESWAWKGATAIVSVSDGVTARLQELGVTSGVYTVGNGVDVTAFPFEGAQQDVTGPTFMYAGTASEWHGAGIFIEAFAEVQATHPHACLVFIGGGSEREKLEQRADSLSLNVKFLPPISPEELASWLRGSSASLASLKPGAGYDFAFPTKLYSSAAAGAPLIFAGVGPAQDFVQHHVRDEQIGQVCRMDVQEVANAMRHYLERPVSMEQRRRVSYWAHETVSIQRVAQKIRRIIEVL